MRTDEFIRKIVSLKSFHRDSFLGILLDTTHNIIPCIRENVTVGQVRANGEISKLAYLTDTGTYIRLNNDALKLLELCNGTNTITDIINELKREYEDPQVREVVWDFVTHLEEEQIVKFTRKRAKEPIKINAEAKLVSPLQHVYIEVTNACNLRCLHCYNNSGVRIEKEFTIDEIKKVISDLANLNVLNVILTGGEPLLRKDLFEIMEYIRRKPMSVTLFTNGTLLNEEVANKLKDCEVLKVLISLDGANPKIHDDFRGMRGAFEKTINAIKLLRQRGINVTVNICINRFNKNEIAQLLQLVRDLRVNDYIIGPLYSAGRAKGKIEELGISVNEYKKALEKIRFCEKQIFGRDKIFVKPSSIANCGIGMRSIVIKSDGTLVPCTSAEAESFGLGNIRKKSLRDLWNNSELLNELRAIDLRTTEKCGRCNYFSFCKGGCRLNAFQMFCDLMRPDPFSCVYYSCVAQDVIYTPMKERETIEFEAR